MENIFYEEQSVGSYQILYLTFSLLSALIVWLLLMLLWFNVHDPFMGYLTIILVIWLVLFSMVIYKRYKRQVRNMFVAVGNETLSYGFTLLYGKTLIEIPHDKIENIGFSRRGFFYIKFCKRPLYLSKTGYIVEVDWDGNKKHGFSITDYESFYHSIRSKVDNNLIDYDPEKLR